MKVKDILTLRWIKKQEKVESRVPIKRKYYRFAMPNDGFFYRNYWIELRKAEDANRAKFPSRRARLQDQGKWKKQSRAERTV